MIYGHLIRSNEVIFLSEVRNPLTTLMKQRYGINRQSSLRLTDKDTLFSTFRKVANYIYKNGDWQEQDYCDAIKHYLEDTQMEDKVLAVKRTSIGASKIGNSAKGKEVFEVQTNGQKSKIKYMVIDADNHSWETQGDRWTHRNRDGVFWYTGNQNYTLGYGKLLHDVYNNWLRGPLKYHNDISPDKFKNFLSRFVKHSYSGKSYSSEFTSELIGSLTHDEFMKATEPDEDKHRRVLTAEFMDKHPLFKQTYDQPGIKYYFYEESQKQAHMKYMCLSFINNYLQNTYNIIRQQRYEHSLNEQSHAKAWETKKNINKETQHIMKMTPLHKYFEGIELDSDVDLRQFSKFQDETMRLMKRLPQGDEQPILRLRKLGNHHAAGMYVPALNTIIVDFRKPSEIYKDQGATTHEEASYSSFIHEYGHYLDRYLGDRNGLSLSLQSEFLTIQQQYAKNLKAVSDSGAKEFDYYTTPTEVFARAFEIYTRDECGLRGNLNKNQLNGIEYQAFDQNLQEKLTNYFDRINEVHELRKTLNLDTSIEEEHHISDDRQNSKRLQKSEELAAFSTDLLEKWTKNSHQLEELISASPKHLDMCNPNRIIAYDKWGQNVPDLVSSSTLIAHGIPTYRYPNVSYIQGYFKKDKTWESQRLYNVSELSEAMINRPRDYAELKKIQHKQRVKGDEKIVGKIVDKQLSALQTNESLEAIKNKIAHYLLTQTYSDTNEKAPFRFTSEERKLVDNLPSKEKQELYTSAIRKSWKAEPKIQQGIKHGLKHGVDISGLSKSLTLKQSFNRER